MADARCRGRAAMQMIKLALFDCSGLIGGAVVLTAATRGAEGPEVKYQSPPRRELTHHRRATTGIQALYQTVPYERSTRWARSVLARSVLQCGMQALMLHRWCRMRAPKRIMAAGFGLRELAARPFERPAQAARAPSTADCSSAQSMLNAAQLPCARLRDISCTVMCNQERLSMKTSCFAAATALTP